MIGYYLSNNNEMCYSTFSPPFCELNGPQAIFQKKTGPQALKNKQTEYTVAQSGGGGDKEGNLENLFLPAQWPSVLYSAKSTERKMKYKRASYSILFYSNHKDWLLSL